MMTGRRSGLAAAVAGVLLTSLLATEARGAVDRQDADDFSNLDAYADTWTSAFNFLGGRARAGAGRAPRAPGVELKVHTMTAHICFDPVEGESPAHEQGWCESGIPQTPVLACDPGEFIPPTWRRLEYSDGRMTDWQRIDRGVCGTVLPVLTVDDFRSLPLPAPVLRLQPDRGWVLVNVETIVMTDATPVPLRTTLAGFGVDVEAVPQQFTYDFGDGHDLVTVSPGRPYPDHDTFHEYEAPGTYAITLTTEWSGRYRVDGDPTWREVTGTATTSSTSAPFEAQERTSRLVDSLCTDRPRPPDC